MRRLLGPVPSKDTQTPPSPAPTLRNYPIFMKDAVGAETNEKSIFRFVLSIFLELWSILFIIFICSYLNNRPKMSEKVSQKMRNILKRMF